LAAPPTGVGRSFFATERIGLAGADERAAGVQFFTKACSSVGPPRSSAIQRLDG
jgi:hypothetical protein